MYFAFKAGKTSWRQSAQCGQPTEPYSITVTRAPAAPSAMSPGSGSVTPATAPDAANRPADKAQAAAMAIRRLSIFTSRRPIT